MKTASELRKRLSRETAATSREERWEEVFFGGYAIAVMKGCGASPGTATGRAAVVSGMDDLSKMKEGSVIVSRNASPALVMAMPRASALATEYGGPGATASEFAREYDIPAVVGVAGLTLIVRDGDLIRVDGTKGIVEIVRLCP